MRVSKWWFHCESFSFHWLTVFNAKIKRPLMANIFFEAHSKHVWTSFVTHTHGADSCIYKTILHTVTHCFSLHHPYRKHTLTLSHSDVDGHPHILACEPGVKCGKPWWQEIAGRSRGRSTERQPCHVFFTPTSYYCHLWSVQCYGT